MIIDNCLTPSDQTNQSLTHYHTQPKTLSGFIVPVMIRKYLCWELIYVVDLQTLITTFLMSEFHPSFTFLFPVKMIYNIVDTLFFF